MQFFEELLWLLFHVSVVRAVGHFTNPSGTDGGTVFSLGQQVSITWTGTENYRILSLGIYSTDNATISWFIGNSRKNPTSYLWKVNVDTLGFNPEASRLFKLLIVNGTNFGAPFESNLFSIATSASPTTTASSTLTNTLSTSFSSTTSGTSTPNTFTSNVQRNPGLTIGAQAGIGSGIALGLLLAVGVFAVFWRRRKLRSHNMPVKMHIGGGNVAHQQKPDTKSAQPVYQVVHEAASHQRYQLDANQSRYELPASTN